MLIPQVHFPLFYLYQCHITLSSYLSGVFVLFCFCFYVCINIVNLHPPLPHQKVTQLCQGVWQIVKMEITLFIILILLFNVTLQQQFPSSSEIYLSTPQLEASLAPAECRGNEVVHVPVVGLKRPCTSHVFLRLLPSKVKKLVHLVLARKSHNYVKARNQNHKSIYPSLAIHSLMQSACN